MYTYIHTYIHTIVSVAICGPSFAGSHIVMANASALWLGVCADGAQYRFSEEEDGRRACRTHMLPIFFSLRHRLKELFGPDADKRALCALTSTDKRSRTFRQTGSSGLPFEWLWPDRVVDPVAGGIHIVGLVRVSTRECAHENGPLTCWSEEGMIQREHYGNPRDGYELMAEEVLQLVHGPQHLSLRLGKPHQEDGVSKINLNQPFFMGVWGGSASEFEVRRVSQTSVTPAPVSVSRVLDAWAIKGDGSELPCLLVPFPIAALLMRNRWRHLFACTRWHNNMSPQNQSLRIKCRPGVLAGWPPESSRAWGCEAEEEIDPVDFDPDHCAEIAQALCEFAPDLLEAAEQRDDPNQRLRLEAYVETLRCWSRSMWQAQGVLRKDDDSEPFVTSSLQLWQCISMSRGLKGGPAALKRALVDAVRIAVPSNMCSAFLEAIESPQSTVAPSPSTMQSANLPVEVALCMYERERWDVDVPAYRWAWSDSSPMAGYDWLWSQFKEISKNWIVPVWRAACRVQLDAKDVIDGLDDDEDKIDALEEFARTHRDQFDILKKHIRLVIEPPIALAAGHRALVHKVAAQVFKWHLQVPNSVPFESVALRYMAHCSDMGTELGTSRFVLTEPGYDGLLPSWVDRTLLETDLPSSSQAPVAKAVSPMAGDERPGGAGALDVTLSDSEEEPDLPPPAHPAERPKQKQTSPQRFLPRCLDIPGLQHICNNLNEDTHKSMSWWPVFFRHLKLLEALLAVPDHNSAYINFCLRGTPWAHNERKVKSFSGSLKEGRWREVLFFLVELNKLLPCLCATWDEAKYTAGRLEDNAARDVQAQAHERKESASGRVKFEPSVVTEALSCGLFYRYCYMAMLVEEVPPALASFGEQCPCHATLLSLDVSEHTKKAMLALHYGEGHTVCPVAGRMMPFLVCGKLEAALEEAWVNNEDKLLTLTSLRGTKPMTENEWAILMGDFRLAKVAPPHRPRAKIMGFDSSPDP